MSDITPQEIHDPGTVPHILIDGFQGLTLHEFVMRLNLITQNIDVATGALRPTVVARLSIPLPTFLRIQEAFEAAVRELEAKGIVTREQG